MQLITRSHAWEPSIRDSFAKMREATSESRKTSITKSGGAQSNSETEKTVLSDESSTLDQEREIDESTADWLVSRSRNFIHLHQFYFSMCLCEYFAIFINLMIFTACMYRSSAVECFLRYCLFFRKT